MWYIIVGIILLTGAVLGTKMVCQNPKENSEKHKHLGTNSGFGLNDTVKAMFSKKQIDDKLKRLAETPPPSKLSYGAECYEKVYREYSVYEYVCPNCGEKTVYKDSKNHKNRAIIEILDNNLGACRNEIEKVKGINIKLDEKEFCEHCSPNTKNPKMYLLVNIAGQNDTAHISDFSYLDIRMIHEFLEDELIHQDDQDFESPLKDNIERIKELLGMK